MWQNYKKLSNTINFERYTVVPANTMVLISCTLDTAVCALLRAQYFTSLSVFVYALTPQLNNMIMFCPLGFFRCNTDKMQDGVHIILHIIAIFCMRSLPLPRGSGGGLMQNNILLYYDNYYSAGDESRIDI